jgi:hypothetical protein
VPSTRALYNVDGQYSAGSVGTDVLDDEMGFGFTGTFVDSFAERCPLFDAKDLFVGTDGNLARLNLIGLLFVTLLAVADGRRDLADGGKTYDD